MMRLYTPTRARGLMNNELADLNEGRVSRVEMMMIFSCVKQMLGEGCLVPNGS